MNTKKQSGFTLIELLVVVAIIAILALIVLLALNPAEIARRSRDSRRLSDLGTIRRAIDLSIADGETLSTTGVNWLTLSPAVSVTDFDGGGLDISKYLSVVPKDPISGGTGTTQYVKSDCLLQTGVDVTTMLYQYKSDGDVYVLRSRMESKDNCLAVKDDGNIDDYYELGTDPGLDL